MRVYESVCMRESVCEEGTRGVHERKVYERECMRGECMRESVWSAGMKKVAEELGGCV
jgi:hypothetical protein